MAVEALHEVGSTGDPDMIAFAKEECNKEAVPTISYFVGMARFAKENAVEVTRKITQIHQQKEAHQNTMAQLKERFN
jgi:hypothetical protein